MIPQAKIVALRQRLERDGSATFNSGGKAWIERRIVVRTAGNAVVVYREEEIAKAYEAAARTISPLEAPDLPELDSRFGVEPPF